jgi:hypothetical protein
MITLSEINTIERLKAYNTAMEFYFFSPDTMRYFRSRIAPDLIHTSEGIVFITSEQFQCDGRIDPRLYTVRIMQEDGDIDDIGGFQQFNTLRQARKFAKEWAAKHEVKS